MSLLRTKIYNGTARNVAFLARALHRGDLVAVPTETVYGLAANALDARACRKIFKAKRRPSADPLIVHIHSMRELDGIAHVNAAALKLARKFWPGPLTIVLPKKAAIPSVVSAGLSSVAIRMPAHPLFRRLLKESRLSLAAPSANPFGYVSPTTAEHVLAGLDRRIRHILDGGPSAIGLESTIVDLRDPGAPRLLRPGAISRAQLQQTLRCRVAAAGLARHATGGPQLAPGMLVRHYSPKTHVVLHKRITTAQVRGGCVGDAWLHFAKPAGKQPANVFWLDARGEARGAARGLFAVLRKLDSAGYRTLHAELAPAGGIGDAINDRLRRAASRR